MSTRCHIVFKQGKDEIKTYRHSDGYPEGVIHTLKEFKAWHGDRNNDLEYTIANWFFWNKLTFAYDSIDRKAPKSKIVKLSKEEILANEWVKLGYGVTIGEDHRDIEYKYIVEIGDMFTVQVYKVSGMDILHHELIDTVTF